MTQPPAPPFALHHIGILTPLARYDETVSSVIAFLRGELEEEGGDAELDIRAAWILVPSGLRLEVFAPRNQDDGPVNRDLARTGGGLHHVSLETTDIAVCKQITTAGGARLVGESDDHAGWAEFFLDPRQTGGALLHWMQRLAHPE